MISRKLIIIFFLLIRYQSSSSQSVYHLQYNFNIANNSITCQSFLLAYNNGSGLARIKYTDPVTNRNVIAEMVTAEEFLIDKEGNEDTCTLVIKAVNSKIIRGDSTNKLPLHFFIFRINPSTGYFEPEGIGLSGNSPDVLPGTFFTARLMEDTALNKAFVSQFFNKDEDLYVSLFAPRTRGFSVAEKKIKIHLLVVADIEDPEVGPSCNKDMIRAVKIFDSLRKYLGTKNFVTKTISGKELSKKNVQESINNLRPSPNDIVIFYYSGHGYRTAKENRLFPNIKLKTFHTDRQDVLAHSLNMEDIFQSIKKKGARLNLVLSDCCNDDILSTNIIGNKPALMRSSKIEWYENNVRTLLLNKTPVSILATAAESGQRASGNNNYGGFFSHFFITSLENYLSRAKTNVSWEQVLQDAKNETTYKAKRTYCQKPYIPENVCRQSPLYKIITGR
jgi:hypothetical protein